MLSDIAADRATEIKLGEATLILVRDGDAVRAFDGKCPHAGAPLAKGAVCKGQIVCPWHKAVFSLHDGTLIEPPALDGLASYPTEIRDGVVYVDPVKQTKSVPAPAPDNRHVVLLGAGAAGVAGAAALREFGFGGRITMISREPDAPYDRTALSKFVLEGGKAPDEIAKLRTEAFYTEHRIERIEATIEHLDVEARHVELDDGSSVEFTHAVIATGGVAKKLDVPGADLDGVFSLRSKADAARIVAQAQPGTKAVILGNSFIGLEAASALHKRGLDVTVVAPDEIPFVKQFGERVGGMFRDLHQKNGIRFQTQTKAARITGSSRVDGVELESGTIVAADLVLVGIGVSPATGFVKGLDLTEDGGIVVDGSMQAAPHIFAVGDIASFPLGNGTARIEHWRVAQQHARVAARNITGEAARYKGVPFFWTYHFGKRFEVLGHATQWDDVIVEGILDDQDFVALQVSQGVVVGIIACQRERATSLLLHRMRSHLPLSDALAVIRAA